MNLILILSSILCSTILIIIIQNYLIRKGKVVEINARSSHSMLATNSGGISVFLSMFLLSIFHYFLGIELFDYKIFVPLSIMALIGFYDDIYEIDFKLKLIFQVIVAKIIIDQGYIISNLHGVLGLFELSSLFAQLITLFIIVSIINAINFIDGIDGLALSVIFIFIICFEFFGKNFFLFDSLSLLVITSTIPLWYFNFIKNKKVFLGDAGSLMFGTLISIYVINILTNGYVIKNEYDLHKILFVISILFYPIVDIIRIFFLRLSKGVSPFVADKNHIHHIILKYSNNHAFVCSAIVLATLSMIFVIQLLFN